MRQASLRTKPLKGNATNSEVFDSRFDLSSTVRFVHHRPVCVNLARVSGIRYRTAGLEVPRPKPCSTRDAIKTRRRSAFVV